MKRILSLALACALALSLAACGPKGGGGSGEVQAIDPSAPAHEQLMAEVGNRLIHARQQDDMGAVIQSEYTYGLAQAEASSLRYAIDTVLWLKGEGENLAQVVGGVPYRDWDDIVGAGLGSDAPFYFEGLLLTIQGKDAEAELCYQRAKANPTCKERDFYYLRDMSVDELYGLKETVAALELEVYEEYTPRTALLAERTGAEFAPVYHLAMAAERTDRPEQALQCAVNALLANPAEAALYGAAAGYAIDAGESAQAQDYLNEGLWAFPQDGTLNYLAAAFSMAAGDTDAAKAFLQTARANADGPLLEKINALDGQMGG
ncbi:MAG: hypothetical protein LIP16_15400 [Clostridium sp.]|nr:hypothetical protein [Clostridium sp.]